MFHCHENGVKTLNVEEGFLLPAKEASGISSAVAEERTAKGRFRHRRKAVHKLRGWHFPARLEGSVDNPLADLRARFRKLVTSSISVLSSSS